MADTAFRFAADREPPTPKTDNVASQPTPSSARPETSVQEPSKATVPNEKVTETKLESQVKTSPETEHDPKDDDLRDVVRQLAVITSTQPIEDRLKMSVQKVVKQSEQPGSLSDQKTKQAIGEIVQDLERTQVAVNIKPEIRNDLDTAVSNRPDLKNESIKALLKITPVLQDQKTVNQIRELANDVSGRKTQESQEITSSVAVLQNKVRLETPVDAASVATKASSQNVVQQQIAPQQDQTQNQQTANMIDGVQIRLPGMAAQLLNRMVPDRPPTDHSKFENLADRESKYVQETLRPRQDKREIDSTMEAGRNAVEALTALENGPGKAIMSRIKEAAKTEPDGLAGVLSEMRSGGKYADLRDQFNASMNTDKALASAYDKAAKALTLYDGKRADIGPAIARHPDATKLNQDLDKMDAAISEKTSALPSRDEEGRNALDEFAKRAAELITKAIDRVKSTVQAAIGAVYSSSPSPSP